MDASRGRLRLMIEGNCMIYFLFHFAMVHVTIFLFIVYRVIIISLLTYTASGPRDSIVWLVPLSLMFPLSYLGYSVFLLYKKQYDKSFVVLLMLVYVGVLFYKLQGSEDRLLENLMVVFIRAD